MHPLLLDYGDDTQPNTVRISWQGFFGALAAGAEGFPPQDAQQAALYVIRHFAFDDAGAILLCAPQ